MRPLLVTLIVIALMLGSAWLLGPHTPPPPLPQTLLGSNTEWLERAERLAQQRYWLNIISLSLTPLWLWLVVRSGWSATLRAWLQQHGVQNVWFLIAVFTCIFVVLSVVLNGPLNYASLALRRAYGLSEETTAAWLVRQGKQLMVTLITTLIAVEGLYWLFRVAPQRWWIFASVGFALFSIALTYLQPYVITPLFFTQRPLEDQALRDAIIQLGDRSGVPISEIYVIDASSQGNEGNAYFTGVGGATRVVLYDTLLNEYPREELLTILAHELGHWRNQHVWQGLLLGIVLAPVGLWLVHIILGWLLPAWGITDRADIAGLPLLLLIVTLGSYVLLPAQNWVSRRWEREADRFALQATGDPTAFQATFVHLAEQNLTDPTPPPIVEGLFGTHPAPGRRVADAQPVKNP